MSKTPLLTVEEVGRRLDVSPSPVWRRIRSGDLPSVRQRGRRLVPASAIHRPKRIEDEFPPFTRDNPLFRLIGAGRGGGHPPGARDKHAILHR